MCLTTLIALFTAIGGALAGAAGLLARRRARNAVGPRDRTTTR